MHYKTKHQSRSHLFEQNSTSALYNQNIVLMQVIRWTPKPQEEERPCTAVELHFAENSGQLMYLDLKHLKHPCVVGHYLHR